MRAIDCNPWWYSPFVGGMGPVSVGGLKDNKVEEEVSRANPKATAKFAQPTLKKVQHIAYVPFPLDFS